MGKFALLLLWLSLVSATSQAQEVFPFETRTPSAEKLTCAEISDDICTTLWSDNNDGSMVVFDGEIHGGTSRKSDMSRWRIEDYRALLDSEPRLPEDLKPRAKGVLDVLRTALKNEKDRDQWYRSVDLAIYYWDNLVTDVASARTKKKYPELAAVKQSELSLDQRILFRNDYVQLSDQITTAKYAQHKNWKRVEKVFAEAKEDVIAAIDELKLTPEKKKQMIESVRKVGLSLPFLDPNKASQFENCNTISTIASFRTVTNKITICAGFFNIYQSDSALYGAIAHEISHSVDTFQDAARDRVEKSALYKTAQPMGGDGYRKMSCTQWQELLQLIQTSNKTTVLPKQSPLQPLYNCLVPRDGIKFSTSEKLAEIAKRNTDFDMDKSASNNSFIYLAQPIVTKHGSQKPNQYFMRPDRLRAADNGEAYIEYPGRRPDAYDIFTQALTCEKVKVGEKELMYADAPLGDRAVLFERGLERTSEVLTALEKDWYLYCGPNCSELVSYNFAKDSGENFADWLEYKALGKRVARIKDIQHRRQAIALASVDLCDAPGVKNDAPDLALVEKKRSFEVHPEHRLRRISAFNKTNAELAECAIDAKAPNFGSCEL